jgi:acyl-CoA thioesterase
MVVSVGVSADEVHAAIPTARHKASRRIGARLTVACVSVGGVGSVHELLAADEYAAALGIRLVDGPAGGVAVEMDVTKRHLNFLHLTHGGAVFSLADCAMSLASNAGDVRAVAIEAHLVITGGSQEGDVLRAVAEPPIGGRTLGTYRITITRRDGRVVGLFTGTVLKT